MLKRTFASAWLRVCVGVFAALAIVLATTAPASASERGHGPVAHSHLTASRHFSGGRVFHGGGGHWHPRHVHPYYRGPRRTFRRY
jgi:hypothetical protein